MVLQKRKMRKMMIDEMSKIRNYQTYVFYGFAYPNEVEGLRERLRKAKVNFRTEEVSEHGKIVGYKVFVLR